MFYLLNQKFAETIRRATFTELRSLAELGCYHLQLDSDLSSFDEIVEILEEMKVQRTSHIVNKPAQTIPTSIPSTEVKF